MWFLAQLVVSITQRGHREALADVHINYHLVQADNEEAAYNKAMEFGESETHHFTNPYGEEMESTFRGLADLTEVYEPLEDLAEIYFEWRVVKLSEVDRLVRDRDSLTVFRNPEEPL